MDNSPFCERCGTRLPGVGELAGLCPNCLLEAGQNAATVAFEESPEPTLDEVRGWFPQLEIESRIGRGGMGVVYRARQTRLDRPVALKVLAPELSTDPRFAERFEREARALARLTHPAVVTVHDFGEVDGRFYLVMEFVEGTTVRQLMRAGIEPTHAMDLVPKICEGLQYAHEQGVVHRDIKPENILVDREGNPKIADFGLAKLAGRNGDATLTRPSQVMGTLHYMAPEQMKDPQAVDHRADIYSLGVMLYEMLTSELPVGRFPPPSRHKGVDGRLDDVVGKALESEPSDRYQSARDVQTDVEGIRRGAAPARSMLHPADDRIEVMFADAIPGGVITLSVVALIFGPMWVGLWMETAHGKNPTWFALAWPMTFFPLAAIHRREVGKFARLVLGAGGVIASTFVAFALSAAPGVNEEYEMLNALACAVFVFGAMLFDRWARGAQTHVFIVSAVLVAVATMMHSSISARPSSEAFYFASGMTAVAAGAGTTAHLFLEYLRGPVDNRLHFAVYRSLGVGLVAAALYFNEYIFD